MKKSTITTLVIILLLALGIGVYFAFFNGEGTDVAPGLQPGRDGGATTTEESSASSTIISGEVTEYDQSQVAADGPFVLTLETADGEQTVEVPSMGVRQCAAFENIAAISDVSVGDQVTVLGALQESGVIVPCASANHYIQIGNEAVGQQGEGADAEGQIVLGQSVEGRDITARTFGSGETNLLFVGGIHGGYGIGTSLLTGNLIDYFENNQGVIPEGVSVTVVETLNPDGLATALSGSDLSEDVSLSQSERVASRFNANDVDLNRNFACNWQSTGTWQSREVDGGSSAFSEPEAQAIRDYVAENTPDAAIVYYASAGAVYSSACNGTPSQASTDLMNTYADASGYDAAGEFTAYEVSGDMVNWMASENIPAISVLLSDYASAEWEMNQAGIEAVLNSFSE